MFGLISFSKLHFDHSFFQPSSWWMFDSNFTWICKNCLNWLDFWHTPTLVWKCVPQFKKKCWGPLQKLNASLLFTLRNHFWCVWGTMLQPFSCCFEVKLKNLGVGLRYYSIHFAQCTAPHHDATTSMPWLVILVKKKKQTLMLVYQSWRCYFWSRSFFLVCTLMVRGDNSLILGQWLWCSSSFQCTADLSHGGLWAVTVGLKTSFIHLIYSKKSHSRTWEDILTGFTQVYADA